MERRQTIIMAKSNFEPYIFLSDNGFFDPIEVIVDDNKHQEISCCDNNISDVNAETAQSRKEKFLRFLWNQTGGVEVGLMMFGLLCTVPICARAFFTAQYGIAVLFAVVLIILFLLGIINVMGKYIAEALYLKNKNLHLEQTLYTLDFNLDIISVNLKNVELYHEKTIYKCSVDENVKDFSEKEVFFTPEAASDMARIIRKKRTEILSEILNGKTNNFLNSTKFFDYAQKYYQINFLDRFYRRISVYDFLMSRDNVIEFCEFIQETMAAEKKDEQKKNAQNEKCSKIVNDILSEKGKDQ